MKIAARRMATCAMMAAVSVVLMMLGGILELGMYAAPLFAGLCFIPIGQKYGRKYHIVLYVVTGILCFLFVPNVEENLMFAGLFGWYPIARPALQKLPRLVNLIVKLVVFNAVVVAIEWLVMTVLVPETVGGVLLWVLLLLGNITFLAYDCLIPRAEAVASKFPL